MRKTWSSWKTLATISCSERAEARSVPNGFSITHRTAASSWRCRPAAFSACTMTGKNSGAVER